MCTGLWIRSTKLPTALVALAIGAFAFYSPPAAFATPASDDADIENRLASLTLETKVGQLFMIGFMGEDVAHSLASSLKSVQPGAIIVFGRNIRSATQVAKLCYDAQQASFNSDGLPLLIAVDQEGGDVARIHTAPAMPSALALASVDDAGLVKEMSAHIGRILKTLGFNMNLAPVMDVTDPNKDRFIGARAFGDDPQAVSRLSGAFADGLEAEGILPTAKHFPGHGGLASGANQDSHLAMPVKHVSLARLLEQDLVPFAAAAKRPHSPAIMLAHISLPEIDSSGAPATFSQPIVTGILRKKLGFEGIVMTDDIEMAGAAAVGDARERAIRAIEAGADLVTIGWSKRLQRDLRQAVILAVRSGRIEESRIDESVRRILRAKQRYASFRRPAPPDERRIAAALRDRSLYEISKRVLNFEVELAGRGKAKSYFMAHADAPIFLFSAGHQFFRSFKEGAASKRELRTFVLDVEGRTEIDRIMRANPDAVAVFYVSGPRSAVLANGISDDVASRMLLVNSETRSLLTHPENFRQIADIYFRHSSTGRAIAETFFGPSPRAPASVKKSKPRKAPKAPSA